jgi:tRNA(fMet)-specific endonuclease VapC
VLKRLIALPVHDVCISVITKSELLFGVEVSPRRQQDETALNAFLDYLDVLDFPDHASLHYAQIRAHLRKLGAMIGANDLSIAAHARSMGLTLVINDVEKFSRVPSLVVENWTATVPHVGSGKRLAQRKHKSVTRPWTSTPS